jgi:NADP-dependent 3-hydroxy acid dehydrogenase YdfG
LDECSATPVGVVEQALERFGRIDSLINNAGVHIGCAVHD